MLMLPHRMAWAAMLVWPVAYRTISGEGDCVSHAVARAVHAVRNDKLSAYHWTKIRGWKLHRFAARAAVSR